MAKHCNACDTRHADSEECLTDVERSYLCGYCRKGYANCKCDQSGNPIVTITDTERLDFLIDQGLAIDFRGPKEKREYWIFQAGDEEEKGYPRKHKKFKCPREAIDARMEDPI